MAKKLKKQKITAIITSPYLRCTHTAEIINKYHNIPIIEDKRFNEIKKDEKWKNLLKRNMEALDDIVKKYNDDDVILCITSGVNLSAFICYFYKIKPSDTTPWSQATAMSPINFTTNNKNLD